ncbi:MAG TPA: hypothetical protein VGI71_24055 [Scandinavium sp.]
MRLIKLTSALLLFIPLAVMSKEVPKYSSAYTKCISSNVADPMSTSCVDSEISAQSKEIAEIAGKHKDIVSPENGEPVDLHLYATQQQSAIDNKCSLWLKSGGQNGILLEKQCALDEVISLKRLLSNFVSTVDD